jgi:hypothetical protein
MPVLCDFITIQFDEKDPKKPNSGSVFFPFVVGAAGSTGPMVIRFNTGGRHHAPALLTLMVRKLTVGGPNGEGGRVAIKNANGEKEIGRLRPSSAANVDLWRHEQFIIPTNVLVDGDNQLVLGRAGPEGNRDPFEVRDIVCFFHQAA